jgi:hypothetical protein
MGTFSCLAHSCNVSKPWCLNCPKCLYVWLGYAAFFDRKTVLKTFGAENPLREEANIRIFRAMVGLEDRLPFDCIGEAGEAALYMSMWQQRGYTGPVIDACRAALPGIDSIFRDAWTDHRRSVAQRTAFKAGGLAGSPRLTRRRRLGDDRARK